MTKTIKIKKMVETEVEVSVTDVTSLLIDILPKNPPKYEIGDIVGFEYDELNQTGVISAIGNDAEDWYYSISYYNIHDDLADEHTDIFECDISNLIQKNAYYSDEVSSNEIKQNDEFFIPETKKNLRW